MNEVTGKIIQISDAYTNPAETFTKQEFVVSFLDGDYQRVAVLEAQQDKVSVMANFNLGDEVKATYYHNGNDKPWVKDGKERYFNCLKLASIEMVAAGIQEADLVAPQSYTAPPEITPPSMMVEPGPNGVFPDNVPF